MIQLLLADDHAIVRGGLRQLLALSEDIAVADEAENGDEVMEKLHGSGYDLILLDLTMPGVSGVDLISRIRTHDSRLPILILSMHNEWQVAKRALQTGACGFVTKGSSPDTLTTAIRKVAAGGHFIDQAVAEQMLFEKTVPDESAPHARLSQREHRIMKELARGKSINAIAEELLISSKTVSTHKARLLQKMNFRSNADLVRYAVDHGLVD